jgi:hypothetical protein
MKKISIFFPQFLAHYKGLRKKGSHKGLFNLKKGRKLEKEIRWINRKRPTTQKIS